MLFRSSIENQYYSNCTTTRASSIVFIETLTEEELNRTGTANSYQMSTRLLLNHIYGHHQHHLNIVKERYF